MERQIDEYFLIADVIIPCSDMQTLFLNNFIFLSTEILCTRRNN